MNEDSKSVVQNMREAPEPNGPAEIAVKAPRPKGFAAMSKDQIKAIASMGGKAAHAAGTGHRFTTEEAKVAGRKGGMAPHVVRGRGRKKGA